MKDWRIDPLWYWSARWYPADLRWRWLPDWHWWPMQRR
jgi:hypothetical protein